MAVHDSPVIIAGAGPVGLTLAMLLKAQGQEVLLFEAVNELKPLGVGINLLPHSVRVLDQLGLTAALDGIAIRTSALHYYNKFGQQIWAEPRGQKAGYKFPQFSIHRGELQMLLFNEAVKRLGSSAIKTAHRLENWEETADGIRAFFATHDGTVEVDGCCLIAADGINSTARQLLYPDEGGPIYGGRILWRGVTRMEPFLDGTSMFMAGHQDCKFVAYPIRELEAGQRLVNWIAELSVPDYKQDMQDWNRQVDIDVFRKPFSSWDFGWLNVPDVIEHCEHVFEFPLSDRDPLPQWSFGNMTLIGDAAHPMYPIGSNGASQGILDAEKLAMELAGQDSITTALANFEAERRPATANIVLSNRKNGPEQVMQIAEERAPQGFSDIEQVIPREELEAIAARYKQTAGFSIEAVNEK